MDCLTDSVSNHLQQEAVRHLPELLRAWFPFDERAARRRFSYRQLHDTYCWWIVSELPAILIGWPICGAVWFCVFYCFAQRWFVAGPYDVAILPPPTFAWALPATFLGLLSCVLLMRACYRFLLAERFEEFEIYGDWRAGYDSRKATPYILYPFLLITIVATAALIDFGDRCTQQELVVNRFLSVGEAHYRYSEIEAIVELSHVDNWLGEKKERPRMLVLFKQGDRWEIDLQPNAKVNRAFVQEIAQRSGRPIQKFETFEDYRRRKRLKGRNFRPFG